MRIYSVSDKYIKYLRGDSKLKNVFDNKENARAHTRKYLGAVIEKDGFNYYIPFSSPKASDYNIKGDTTSGIRKSIIPIIRMIHKEENKADELLGTLKISNMIPVPKQELDEFIFDDEIDIAYKTLTQKEYAFIKANSSEIIKNSNTLYWLKEKEKILKPNEILPNFVKQAVDFKYAEQKYLQYCHENRLALPDVKQPSNLIDETIMNAKQKAAELNKTVPVQKTQLFEK